MWSYNVVWIITFLSASLFSIANSSPTDNTGFRIIHEVNHDPASTWKAGENYIPGDNPKRLMGVLPRDDNAFRLAPIKKRQDTFTNDLLPVNFDARQRWPECASLLASIKDQSNCGSCWAVSAASVFSDRLCIASGGAVAINLSAEQLNSCCYRCGNGCDGGYPEMAWHFFTRHGLVTGGDYNSNEGCQPYSIFPCGRGRARCIDDDPETPECFVNTCSNSNYTGDYRADLHYTDDVYTLTTEEDIMHDIYTKGPVQAVFDVYTDFMYYKSGVYKYTRGAAEGGHAVRILGWGVENGLKYWLITNSWSSSWGDKGLVKILRGVNECGIESGVIAGTPHLRKH
ncbi:cathepsin B-like cysteine proteinase 5 isoform X2 [Adelges cooleyi]|uniref:cathepsin B-like cysteine proteinase 5 isoform X2 n=1 Tax=Adelges cooleyi TaxID=133065 RepID=UPI0021808F05|nr:cathepsin B-like cysteine proteinase 5 isoform X2 [Adelges cooleyi]